MGTVTPDFILKQDNQFVYFEIKCPNVRGKEIEMILDGFDFHFYAEPYLLKLTFQHKLIEDQQASAKYNIEEGIFFARLSKAIEGEDFKEILLLSTMKPFKKQSPKIELSEGSGITLTDEPPDPFHYGFNLWASNFFENLTEKLPYITDIPKPDSTMLSERRILREERENEDFDPDKIISDYIQLCKTEQNPKNIIVEVHPEYIEPLFSDFTPEERRQLLEIPRKDFIIFRDFIKPNFRSLVDILYGAIYDIILFGAEGSCESHWTIAKLSATLSWFDIFNSDSDLIISCAHRTFVYPILRTYEMVISTWNSVVRILIRGRTPVIKALLHASKMMEKGEYRWRLNRLYITPIISWVQEIEEEDYFRMAHEIEAAVAQIPSKENIAHDWCIDLLEKYARKEVAQGNVPDLPEEKDLIVASRFIEDP